MGFSGKPPPLPIVPPPPDPSPEGVEAKAAKEGLEAMRKQAGAFGRRKTIVAGGYDPNQATLGAKTLLGG